MQFANPLFLIALVAVSIPVIVHLFNFRRYRKVYFSNTARLKSMQEETRKQSKLRSLLVLAARVLAIVFLVLAFARPFVPWSGADALQNGERSAVSIYIDNSFSMQQASTDGVLLDCAKRKAEEIVAAYAPSDLFQLVTNDLSGSQFRWLSRDDFLSALDEVAISPSTVMLSEVTRRQHQFLHTSGAANKRAYQLSDFQKSTSDFVSMEGRGVAAEGEQASLSSAEAGSVTFIPFAAESVNNLYIDSVSLSAPAFCKGADVVATVRLHNDGESAVEQVPIRLYIDGRQRTLTSVDIPAGGVAEVPMHFSIEHSGVLEGFVETSDYPVTFDDTLFFSLNVAPQINVLDIYGKEENPYLRKLYGLDSTVAFRSVSVQNAVAVLSEGAVAAGYDVVVVDEPSVLPSHLTQSLSDYVAGGGTLLVILPENADVESYNRLLASVHAPLVDGFVKKNVQMSSVDVHHPLYANVFDRMQETMEAPSVTGYFKMRPASTTLSQNVIASLSGDGFLIAFYPSPQQTSYILTAPLRPAYTDFCSQSLFVPTFYDIALYSRLCPPVFFGMDATARPVELPQHYFSSDLLRLTRSDMGDASFSCVPHLQKNANHWQFAPAGQIQYAGNYLFSEDRAGRGSATGVFGVAFNYSRKESQMSFCESADFPKDENNSVLTPSRSVALSIGRAKDLSPWCIALCLAMLLAEVLFLRLPLGKQKEAAKK